ncbi:MAG TPA: 4a-hydroxytetrahydrobiopterin dehydratase [Terrimicrobiaceae bacterium]|nr:4a-hydroxytetrahydrobiopterin dehydratase [Terrimicrobiaceae bacterium]
MADLLTEEEILARLSGAAAWERRGSEICREIRFAGFPAAMRFVNAIAEAAEAANHHPDIDIRWSTVRLALSTHSQGGLTDRDFAMARTIDALAEGTARAGNRA